MHLYVFMLVFSF